MGLSAAGSVHSSVFPPCPTDLFENQSQLSWMPVKVVLFVCFFLASLIQTSATSLFFAPTACFCISCKFNCHAQCSTTCSQFAQQMKLDLPDVFRVRGWTRSDAESWMWGGLWQKQMGASVNKKDNAGEQTQRHQSPTCRPWVCYEGSEFILFDNSAIKVKNTQYWWGA